MSPQQLNQHPQPIESRVSALEAELKQVKQLLASFLQPDTPWWYKVAGTFEADSTFDDAVRYGQEWRKSNQ